MPRKDKLLADLEDVREEVKDQELDIKSARSSSLMDTETRQEVAKKFVKYYFFILLMILVVVPLYNYYCFKQFRNTDLLVPLKDMILTYSAVVGPTLGLVVAYYFKNSDT